MTHPPHVVPAPDGRPLRTSELRPGREPDATVARTDPELFGVVAAWVAQQDAYAGSPVRGLLRSCTQLGIVRTRMCRSTGRRSLWMWSMPRSAATAIAVQVVPAKSLRVRGWSGGQAPGRWAGGVRGGSRRHAESVEQHAGCRCRARGGLSLSGRVLGVLLDRLLAVGRGVAVVGVIEVGVDRQVQGARVAGAVVPGDCLFAESGGEYCDVEGFPLFAVRAPAGSDDGDLGGAVGVPVVLDEMCEVVGEGPAGMAGPEVAALRLVGEGGAGQVPGRCVAAGELVEASFRCSGVPGCRGSRGRRPLNRPGFTRG